MIATSKKRGIEVTSISRPIKPSDFRDFDLILAMDRQNYGSLSTPFGCVWETHCFCWCLATWCTFIWSYAEDILSSFERWQQKEPLPDSAPKKVRILGIICWQAILPSLILHIFLAIPTVKVYSLTPDLQVTGKNVSLWVVNTRTIFLLFPFSHIMNLWYSMSIP
jgi:hypothetical protein